MQQKLVPAVLLLGAVTAHAATLDVNGTTDDTTADDFLSLREAVLLVNNKGNAAAALGRALTTNEMAHVSGTFGDDAIVLSPPAGATNLALTKGELLLQANVSIRGPGADRLGVSGNDANRVFYVSSGVTGSISGLTLSQGRAQSALNADSGGAIYNAGDLLLQHCVLSSNSVSPTAGYGGALVTAGTVRFDSCTIGPGNSALIGGGIYVAAGGALTMLNCTVSGNTSPYFVGGIAVDNGGDAALTNCTITANRDVSYAGGYGGYAPTLLNTIIAGNSSSNATPDIQTFGGSVNSLGHNLIGVGDGATAGWLKSDHVGANRSRIDARLGPLALQGGPTPTHALLVSPTSPAVNNGDDSVAAEFDQRGPGFTRRYGTMDIGAYELQGSVLAIFRDNQSVVVSWPTNNPNFRVQWAPRLNEPVVWTLIDVEPSVVGAQFQLTNAYTPDPRFFQLLQR